MISMFRRVVASVRRALGFKSLVFGPVHCVNCGFAYVAVIPASSPHYYADLGVIDMLECPDCGLFTVCSD